MVYIRMFIVLIHILIGCIISLFFFIIANDLKNFLIKKWSEILLVILKVNIVNRRVLTNHFQKDFFLVFSNHISWLDIIIYNSIHPMTFVAKDDVKKWPLIGFLASQANTIFINRKNPFDVKKITKIIDNKFLKNKHVCIFPEGSSTNGRKLLKFKSNFFQSAINSNKNILPICISYLKNNKLTTAPAYCDEISFFDSLVNILKCNGIESDVTIFEEITPKKGRKELADETYNVIYKKIVTL